VISRINHFFLIPMKTNILITHIENTLNYGSAMMALNLIHGLMAKTTHELEIFCECDDYNLDRLKEGSGVYSLKKFDPASKDLSFSDKIEKYVFGNHQSIKDITTKFDVMIVLGGDDLSEVYKKGTVLKGSVYQAINKDCQVILASQSFGPFTGLTKWMTAKLFKDITIISRDDNSFHFTKNQMKIKNVLRSRDFALLPLPDQEKFNKILDEIPGLHEPYVTLVPSGLWRKYASNQKEYVQTWLGILEMVKMRFPNHQVVLLGHVLKPEKCNDLTIIHAMMKQLTTEEKEGVIPITAHLQPAEARAILGKSDFVITGRMHAAVSTFFMKKPAISLAYSEKYSGVIGRGLDLQHLIIDSRGRTWGRNSPIINEVSQKIDLIENQGASLTQKIIAKTDECQVMVNDQIDFILEKIESVHPKQEVY
jgi:colanic acid/amylovoran biosynthesis protein